MANPADADRLRREPTDPQTLTTETLSTPTVTLDVSTWDRLRSMLKGSTRPVQNTPDPSFQDPSLGKSLKGKAKVDAVNPVLPDTHDSNQPQEEGAVNDNESQGARSKATTTHSTHYTLDQDAESSEHFPADRRPIGPYCKLPKTPNRTKQIDRDAIARWIESTYETDNPWTTCDAAAAAAEQQQQQQCQPQPVVVSSTDETSHNRLRKLKDRFRWHH